VSLERVNPAELAPPKGFSHAVTGRGTVIFLAGQTALDSAGKIAGEGVTAQFEQALGNLLAALAAAGGQPSDLASLTIYLTDVAEYQAHGKEIGAVWRRLAGQDYPAMAGVGVTQLWLPGALVEIQGIAVVSRS
jgi:enamine deaminase RidA (YjgF/YER057c/UK114 family)